MVKSSRKQGFLRGAAILGVCGFIGKLLGAVYRIPLTNILGAEGMGLYQMVFPMYTLLLTVSSGGLPSAISRMVAERNALRDERGVRRVFGVALVTLAVFGLLTSGVIALFGSKIAALQGNADAAGAYLAIAPSLLLVSLIAAFRGYFQGRQNMFPSALSQITEQAVKMGFGLYLAYYFLPRGVAAAAAGAVVGITISEFVALAVLFLQYFFDRSKFRPALRGGFLLDARKLYAISIPITLGGIVLPITQLIDSILVINLLMRAGESQSIATSLYGLSTGPVSSLINMPVVLSLAIAAAVIPAVSAARVTGDTEEIRKKAGLSLKLTAVIALPCFVGLCVLAHPIINLLYSGGLKTAVIDEPGIAGNLLALLAGSVLFIAFIQVSTSLLQAMSKNYLPVLNLMIGAGVKIALNALLTPSLGIYGSAFATLACYLVAFVLDIIALARHCPLRLNLKTGLFIPVICALISGAAAYFGNALLANFIHEKIAVCLAILIAAGVYFLALILLGGIGEDDFEAMPALKRIFGRRKRQPHVPPIA